MSLETQLQNMITAIGTEFKAVKTSASGNNSLDLSGLSTTDKSSLVAAINEVFTSAGLAAVINDAAASATETYSSNKITADIAAAVSALVDAAPADLDTLNEIAAALADDANLASTLNAAIALKANSADVKTVTELGATVDTNDYAADFAAALL